jgi:hypothetical protein
MLKHKIEALITVNLETMFRFVNPAYVSASRAELGDTAGQITWRNALDIGAHYVQWLVSDYEAACEAMRDWARSTGAWSSDEIAGMADCELFALLAQNIAADLREYLDSDNRELAECVALYMSDRAGECTGHYYFHNAIPMVDYYTGC